MEEDSKNHKLKQQSFLIVLGSNIKVLFD